MPGFLLLLSCELRQPEPLWGLGRLGFSSPFQHFHGYGHQQLASETNALANTFIEILKTIPKTCTGGRAIERYPGWAEGGVKPCCGEVKGIKTVFWREAWSRWVLAQSMLRKRGVRLNLWTSGRKAFKQLGTES